MTRYSLISVNQLNLSIKSCKQNWFSILRRAKSTFELHLIRERVKSAILWKDHAIHFYWKCSVNALILRQCHKIRVCSYCHTHTRYNWLVMCVTQDEHLVNSCDTLANKSIIHLFLIDDLILSINSINFRWLKAVHRERVLQNSKYSTKNRPYFPVVTFISIKWNFECD